MTDTFLSLSQLTNSNNLEETIQILNQQLPFLSKGYSIIELSKIGQIIEQNGNSYVKLYGVLIEHNGRREEFSIIKLYKQAGMKADINTQDYAGIILKFHPEEEV
ncbi:MAG: hypothetical protein JNK26_01545 [Candidatus Doudnabacteria bacterium]|nr:hypothetical protein [Candidatus Doudnabacteria bacterium]